MILKPFQAPLCMEKKDMPQFNFGIFQKGLNRLIIKLLSQVSKTRIPRLHGFTWMRLLQLNI